MEKQIVTSSLNLETATKIIALSKLDGVHDHSFESLCLSCKSVRNRMMEYEGIWEMGWNQLSGEAHGYFQGYKDAIKYKAGRK